LVPPNDTVYLGEEFVVSYKVTISSDFYERFANHSYFDAKKCVTSAYNVVFIILFFNSAAEAQQFCEDVDRCPNESHRVNEKTCCVHHANIHVCAPSVSTCNDRMLIH